VPDNTLLSANPRANSKQVDPKKAAKAVRRAPSPKRHGAKSPSPEERAARQIGKMEAIGKLAGGIAHDFNNLLTVILGHSEFLLKRDETAKNRHFRIDEIRKAAERGAWLTNQLLAYSRNQILEPTVLQFNPVLEDMDGILRRVLGEDIALDLLLEPDLWWVKVDRGQLQQIILNLAGNARDAMPQGGRLSIDTINISVPKAAARPGTFLPAGEYAAIIAHDSGLGMTVRTRARIFEPFFTTKEKGKGTGLGLATVYGIVKQSGGYIWAESRPGCGSAFYTLLPRVPMPDNRDAQRQEVFQFRSGGETILLVEDDPALRKMAAEVLRDTGYKVLTAPSGADALRIVAEHPDPVDALLTDVVMPGMTGRQLAEQIVARFPRIRVLYMSGYTDDAIGNHGLHGKALRILQKPFTHEALVHHVRAALESVARQ
jgi:CheY-like chemotaxis protein/nitrogen-specific signal transduction histidine kinase